MRERPVGIVGLATETVCRHFGKNFGDIPAQTLVKHQSGNPVVVNENIINRIIKAVERVTYVCTVAVHDIYTWTVAHNFIESIGIIRCMAVNAFSVGLRAFGKLHQTAIRPHRLVILEYVYAQRVGIVPRIAHFNIMYHELVPRKAHGQQMIGNELIHGIVRACKLRIGCKRIGLLAAFGNSGHYFVRILYYSVPYYRFGNAPFFMEYAICLDKGRVAVIPVRRILQHEVSF